MARPDPYKWIGAFRASINQVVSAGYAHHAQTQALDILRQAHALDQGLGAGWEDALQMSAAAGFAPGVEFILDRSIPIPSAHLARLRRDHASKWIEHLLSSGSITSVYLAKSPSDANPPSIPGAITRANQALVRRMFFDQCMAEVTWKQVMDLVLYHNPNMAFDLLVSPGRVEPLASRSSLDHLIQLVHYKSGLFTLSDLAAVSQASASWRPPNLAQAVFAEWWNQSPCLAKRGERGCLVVLDMLKAVRAPNGSAAISKVPGRGMVLSAMRLLERSGYTHQQIFRAASRRMENSLASIAISENEPETLRWLVDRGLDLSGNNFLLDRTFTSRAVDQLPANSFWAAIVERIDMEARRADAGNQSDQLEQWWGCVHYLLEDTMANLLLRSHLRSAKVSFSTRALQDRWESVVGHAALQRTVEEVPSIQQDVPPPRPPSRF